MAWWLQVIIGKAALRKNLIILWVGVMSENKEYFLNWHYYVQSVNSVSQSCLTCCNPMDCSTPGLPVHYQLMEFTQTHVYWVSDIIQPSHPLLLPSDFPSIRVFSNESVLLIRWPKYWSFSFSINEYSNECSGLISFRMDWLDLLAIQGTLKSLLQHHSSKASIPQPSAFFIVQLSHPYMITGKTIALTRWTFITLPTFVKQQVNKPYVVACFLSFFFF